MSTAPSDHARYLCPHCSYDLEGIADDANCPECGTRVRRPSPPAPFEEPQSDPTVVRDSTFLYAMALVCGAAASAGRWGVIAIWGTFALWVLSSWTEFSRTQTGRFGWVAWPMLATALGGTSFVAPWARIWWATLWAAGAVAVIVSAYRARQPQD